MFRLSNRINRTIFSIFVLLCALQCSLGQVLTPPYFNLAQGRRIIASSTCGEDVPEPELFCKLVGANAEGENFVIQGQVCDRCDPKNDSKKHPAEFAVDGRETWWQSPPLSRGMKYNKVNLTIDLGQEFHVAYVIVKMGNSPRPGVWALERSNDNGQTYLPWQYFADNMGECIKYFGNVSTTITADDSVICDTQYSGFLPPDGGEIAIRLVKNRPSEENFFNSTVLQEFTRATNVRFRLLKVKNFLGHLMSVARQDPTTTRRYFYSIRDISIGGRCRCNGHAETCTEADKNDLNKLICDCKDNTCGHNCEMCCPGFEQKKWSQSKPNKKFVCERCNCFGHSDQCHYNETVDQLKLSLDIHGNYEGGGVCQNCQHFTEGINCDKCMHGFYRPYGKYPNETDACQPCRCEFTYSTGNCEDGTGKCECKPEYTKPDCNSCSFGHYGYPLCRPCECYPNGTYISQCSPENGRCFCKPNYGGDYCRNCTDGYYSFPECKPCECNQEGSLSNVCNAESGDCKCKSSFSGRTCDQCNEGYYQFPNCLYCNCDQKGTLPGICNKTNGQCLCKPGYGGPRCDQCLAGFTGFPDCKPCNCSTTGSASTVCDITGKCTCLARFSGKTCDQCSPGYYLAPQCQSCNCNPYGTNGVSCDGEGNCQCKKNFDGQKCDRCREGYYKFPACEECIFDPAGVISSFKGCTGLKPDNMTFTPPCKANVQGNICNQCKDLFWNLNFNNPDGCEECSCNRSGTIGRLGLCDLKSGQCTCKPSVTSRKCDQCADGWYNLTDGNLFGCTDCGCDFGGSQSNICNKQTGQCTCLPRIEGRNCKEPINTHYFPTLHQYQFEVEDGRTPAFTPVRYGFDEKVFPGYSWKGYAVYSHLQNETIHPVVIEKASVYRIVLRYINFNSRSVTGTISAIPEYSGHADVEQKFQVVFKPSTTPGFVTMAGISGNSPLPFVLNPGPWIFKIKNEKSLFLDYFVLVPAEYYEGSSLVSNVTTPCTLSKTEICRQYLYPNLSPFDQVKGVVAYTNVNNNRSPVEEFYDDLEKQLGMPKMPKLSRSQKELFFNLILSRPGDYVFVVNYGTVANQDIVPIQIQASTQSSSSKGTFTAYPCRYLTLCRQVVTDDYGRVAVWNLNSNNVNVILNGQGLGEGTGIDSVVAIPLQEWSTDYVKPKPSCVMNDGKCVSSNYLLPPDSKQFDFKTGNENRITKSLPSTILDKNTELVYLDDKDSTIDITGKVPKPGPYTFIVHFYQPDHTDFDATGVIHNGQMYDTKVRLHYCPGVSGCRSVVKQQNGNNIFQLTENFVFSLTARKGVWVQYVLLIPSDQYTPELITELPFDRTNMFITKCGQNHFHLSTSEEGFCKEATFTLTTKYNHGALPCRCDWDGSKSFECEKFGGQCPCRENVIGKRCDNCKTGYFGFPYCRSCNCSSTAVCDPNTGDCICPHNVVGEKCNQCQPYTFGFDPIIGCEECNCHIYGVENNDLQCDLFTGACKCKKNIEGRSCDRCVAGFHAFPYCEKCTCDLRGTTNEICNQTNAACLCKANVQGAACDVCKEGTFNLQRDEPAGCTKCFCFGRTFRCSSSTLFLSAIISYNNWSLASINNGKSLEVTSLPTPINIISGGISVNMAYVLENSTYFVAPQEFVGNKLTAYGGSFNYTIHYTASVDRTAIPGPDVILYGGNDTYVQFTSNGQPDTNSYFPISIKMVENEFQNPSFEKATREEFMQILQNLTAIYVKASYVDRGDMTELVGVSLEIGIPEYSPTSGIALAVEQCDCPPNYVGLSCEDCADGYYRSSNKLLGGNCVPCQCNGHATTCDKTTGICIDCKHNTKGDHCEKCEVGYYGNSSIGSPNDCLICACPLPIQTNNFATGCDINESGDRIICDCIEGYTGDHCERCAPGYYGDPTTNGARCVPCQCNGNINASEENSCDPYTGKCLKCLNNTSGDSCERCALGYYGDAIVAKDCQPCVCDTCGTQECNHRTGRCSCYENVVGEKCDRCADNHFGFTTCTGCRACNCAGASSSAQCDDLTGYCRCKEGVVGQVCDRCAAGYWKYTDDGCTSCGCNIGYSVGVGCNSTTGLCQCLPGVIGDKCDTCPYRSVLIPEEGCFTCDNCTHGLLDVTDKLNADFLPVYNRFQSKAEGYFTSVRLAYINNTATALAPNVSDVLSYQFDLAPYENKINAAKREKETSLRKIQSIYNDLISSTKKSHSAVMDALKVEMLMEKIDEGTRMTVYEIEKLIYNLNTGAGSQIDYAISEAKMINQRIQETDISESKKSEAENVEQKARDILAKVNEFVIPINKTGEKVHTAKENVEKLLSKLEELQGYTEHAQNLIVEASNDNQSEKKAKLVERIKTLEETAKEANKVINDATKQTENITQTLSKAKMSYEELNQNLTKLKAAKEEAGKAFETLLDDTNMLREKVFNAKSHAKDLGQQADILDSIIKDKVSADQAVKAANSYKDIANALEIALQNATDAKNIANSFEEKLQGIDTKVMGSDEKSNDIISQAQTSLKDVQQNLEIELTMTLQKEALASKNINQTEERVDSLKKSVEKIKKETPEVKNLNVQDVSNKATDTLKNIKGIAEDLPEKLTNAKDLYSKLDDTMKSAQQIGNYLNQIDNQDPEIGNGINKLKTRPDELKAKEKTIEELLNDLKQKINITRDLVDKIKVGVSLGRKAAVELPIPSNMLEQGSSNDLSVFFKSDQPSGLLLYVGNEANPRVKRETSKTRRPKTEDFLALEIENGYLVLTSSLGERTPSNLVLNDKFVADNQWYKVEIVRVGKTVNLTLFEEKKSTSKAAHYPGENVALNLDKEHSKFFIGGLPPTFEAPTAIKEPTFSGQIEELTIDGIPIGLWNFVSVSRNSPSTPFSDVVTGALARNVLLPTAEPKGCRFSGGYVMIKPIGISLIDETNILLNFKTTASNGLIFLVFKDTVFISIEIRQGFIYFKFDIGSGLKSFHTPMRYNDDQWHKLSASRNGNLGLLDVDGNSTGSGTSDDRSGRFYGPDHFFFGGYPGNHKLENVVKDRFEGCIDRVQVNSIEIGLNNNLNSHGITPGCPDKYTRIVTFEKDSRKYVRWPIKPIPSSDWSNEYPLGLSLRIKTSSKYALIAYGIEGTNSFYLTLNNGSIVFKIGKSEVSTGPNMKYHDDRWHSVMAMHNGQVLLLIIDDFDIFKSEIFPAPFLPFRGIVYFGSVPSSVDAIAGFESQFTGSLGDAVLNGVLINLDRAYDRDNNKEPDNIPTTTAVAVTPPSSQSPMITTPTPGVTAAPGCLPLNPANDPDINEDSGSRFGTTRNSFYSYEFLQSTLKDKVEFSLELKTVSTDGIIFYVTDPYQKDYIALYMKEAKLHYDFACGASNASITSEVSINQGEWHKIEFSIDQNQGLLKVAEQIQSTSVGCQQFNIAAPYYIGGADIPTLSGVTTHLNGFNKPFVGCLKNFMANGNEYKKPTFSMGVIPCSSKVESGTFFPASGGYLKAYQNFKVGSSAEITMEIRPRKLSGILLGVHSKKAYMILQMIDGAIKLTVDHGSGQFFTIFKPQTSNYLCDGRWHTIKAAKAKSLVVLTVDGTQLPVGTDGGGIKSASTNHPLYVGGYPADLSNSKGIETKDVQYVGCIRNLEINANTLDLSAVTAFGNVMHNICPII